MRLSFWLLLIFTINAAHAQQAKYDPGTNETRIEQGLRSASALDVVWAAWRTKSTCCGRWDGALREALQKAASAQRTQEQHQVIRFLLDAMIQSRTPVPVSELLPLYEDYPDAALALMVNSFNHDDGQLLLLLARAARENNSARWLLLASLLTHSRTFDERLLDELRFEFVIDVVEGNYLPVLQQRSFVGVMGGSLGGIMAPNYWPEMPGQYCLTVTPEPRDVVITTRAEPVYLRRSVNDQNTCDHAWKTSRSAISLRLLASFPPRSNFWPEFPLLTGGKATVIWQGVEETRRILQRAAQDYFEDCRRLLVDRGTGGMVTRSWSDAELRSRITISVKDLRQDKRVPIPEVDGIVRLVRNP